ncbi:hypothetical protein RRG08_061044 [Elysia crispata]|uniref:Uncharacterized protein n=1 Tax=Elysia crispata TaxID=231223 RepID=A0AAE1AUX0_9GAST|nr:hypothetical protein RRG08_061044 [Elysia crispata]
MMYVRPKPMGAKPKNSVSWQGSCEKLYGASSSSDPNPSAVSILCRTGASPRELEGSKLHETIAGLQQRLSQQEAEVAAVKVRLLNQELQHSQLTAELEGLRHTLKCEGSGAKADQVDLAEVKVKVDSRDKKMAQLSDFLERNPAADDILPSYEGKVVACLEEEGGTIA